MAPLPHLALRFNQRMIKINSFLGGGKIEEAYLITGTRRLNQGCVETSLSSVKGTKCIFKNKTKPKTTSIL